MAHLRLRTIPVVLIVASLLLATKPSAAQSNFDIGPSKGQVVWAAVGAIAAVTVIGVVIYFAVREPRVTGCVAAGPDGKLTLQGNSASDLVYLLENAPPTLQAGQRAKIFGHKKKAAGRAKVLNVDRVTKIYGACSPPALTSRATLDVPSGPYAIAPAL